MNTRKEVSRCFPNIFNPLDSHGVIHDTVSSHILGQLALYYGELLEEDFEAEFRTINGLKRRSHLFAVGVLEGDGTVNVTNCDWMAGRVRFVEGRRVVEV